MKNRRNFIKTIGAASVATSIAAPAFAAPSGLSVSTFEDQIGDQFVFRSKDNESTINMSLDLAESVKWHGAAGEPGRKDPFSLVFISNEKCEMPTKGFQVHAKGVGKVDMALSLCDIDTEKGQYHYEAIFA